MMQKQKKKKKTPSATPSFPTTSKCKKIGERDEKEEK